MDNIYLSIAGFNIKISFHQPENTFFINRLQAAIKTHYQGFSLAAAPKKADFEIRICGQRVFEIIPKKIGGREKSFLNVWEHSGRNKIVTYHHISALQFQYILKNVVLELLARDKGFIIHASASKVGDEAVLFTGQPGAGKSTAMSLLHPKFCALADDSAIIRKIKGRFYFFQTPLTEKNSWVKKGSPGYKIKGVFFLRKSLEFKTERLDNKTAVLERLSKQLFTEERFWSYQGRYLLEFVNNTSFYSLFFAKDRRKTRQLFA